MSNSALHQELVDLLGLAHAPVAITFRDEPSSAPAFDHPMSEPTSDGRSGRASASCAFWAHGHETTFSTVPADHGNCSVGLFTHGLAQAGDILDKTDVGTLLEVGWVTMEAFAGVATLDRSPASIEYGPLGQAMHTPDVVMLRVSPRQMMEIGDAVAVEFSGKPQCQIIPRAAAGSIAVSMGCALSRERTGMGDDELTCAIPGNRVAEVVERLRDVCRADNAVVGYAIADKQRFI
jgi:uncharacterized protein (DUF169 family)